jgi:NADP-dependent 3-hydroxy acid dehydrogenase YdfG
VPIRLNRELINISSVAGRTARPGNAVYAATKWGINGFSEALRQELQPGIRVTEIEPGAVATELTDHIAPEATKAGAEKNYAQTAITAQGIANEIAFAVAQPHRVTLNEILIRPTTQAGGQACGSAAARIASAMMGSWWPSAPCG